MKKKVNQFSLYYLHIDNMQKDFDAFFQHNPQRQPLEDMVIEWGSWSPRSFNESPSQEVERIVYNWFDFALADNQDSNGWGFEWTNYDHIFEDIQAAGSAAAWINSFQGEPYHFQEWQAYLAFLLNQVYDLPNEAIYISQGWS